MTDRAKLLELAERVERATGAQQAEMLNAARDAILGGDVATAGSRLDSGKWIRMIDAESYESAAMSLVPSGWKLRQMNFSAPCVGDRSWHLNLHGGNEGKDCFVGRGATPALALTAAALRALATKEPA